MKNTTLCKRICISFRQKVQLLVIVFLSLALLLGGCIASYDYNVKGTWDYALYASDGHAYDKGTVTFTGNPMSGNFP